MSSGGCVSGSWNPHTTYNVNNTITQLVATGVVGYPPKGGHWKLIILPTGNIHQNVLQLIWIRKGRDDAPINIRHHIPEGSVPTTVGKVGVESGGGITTRDDINSFQQLFWTLLKENPEVDYPISDNDDDDDDDVVPGLELPDPPLGHAALNLPAPGPPLPKEEIHDGNPLAGGTPPPLAGEPAPSHPTRAGTGGGGGGGDSSDDSDDDDAKDDGGSGDGGYDGGDSWRGTRQGSSGGPIAFILANGGLTGTHGGGDTQRILAGVTALVIITSAITAVIVTAIFKYPTA
jgi:hypothetical protein